MRITDHDRADRRPRVSPQYPKHSAPSGLARKPTANTLNVAISDREGSEAGKNRTDKIGAKYPKSAKSYHSRTLPMAPARTVVRSARGLSWTLEVESFITVRSSAHHTTNRLIWYVGCVFSSAISRVAGCLSSS